MSPPPRLTGGSAEREPASFGESWTAERVLVSTPAKAASSSGAGDEQDDKDARALRRQQLSARWKKSVAGTDAAEA